MDNSLPDPIATAGPDPDDRSDVLPDDGERRDAARSEPPASGEMVQQVLHALDDVVRRQDSLALWLRESTGEHAPVVTTPADDVPYWAAELQAAVSVRLSEFELRVMGLIGELRNGRRGHEAAAPSDSTARPPDAEERPQRASVPVSRDAGWLPVMLGTELSNDPQLASAWRRLQQQVLAGDPAALLLLGQLLVFRFAESGRKPALLKEVGEAYYRYAPKAGEGHNPLEHSLARWLDRECEATGLPNSIELVHAGERFDAMRHAPVERGGVEIVQVLGWIVLRDAGRVFSKALVLTR